MTAPEDTLVIAHRGAWGKLRENTLEAFEEAIRLGADMVELDVRRTGDGQLVAHHDPIGQLRHHELSPLPPLLDDVVARFAARIALNIELKERGCEDEVVELLTRVDNCLVTSFRDDIVRAVKARAPHLRTGLIIDDPTAGDPVARALRANADVLVLEAGVADAATTELPCLIWTVNEQDEIDRFLVDPAVSGLITDQTALALARREALSGRTARATPS